MTGADDQRRTRRMQRAFLVLLGIATAELGWWMVDQVRYTDEVRANARLAYEADTAAARALLRAGRSWTEVKSYFPALTITADSATIAVSPVILDELHRERFHRLNRYAWEGAFFLAVLLGAMTVVSRALREEAELRRRQEQFLAGMSHELKSPLASVRLSLETLALRDPPAPQRGELVRRMLVELGRLQGAISNVLDTSRLATHGTRHAPETLSLREEVAHAVEDVADFAAEGEVGLATSVPEDVTVRADREGMRIVIRNLLHNAIKASPAGGTVLVRAAATDGQVILEVRDEGAGFPPEEAARIFEKFYRIAREERGRMQGTGLGLYLVRRHVELERGSVTAVSPGPGRGAAFTVRWPAAAGDATA
jgi:signal transduction histidine kinase